MNKITLNFDACSPAPARGYKIFYRVDGSSDPYTDAGNFFNSPAIFYDNVNPDGTCYEGYLVSDCSDDFMGNHIAFESCGSGGDNSSCGTSISQETADLNYVDLGFFDLHVDGAATVNIGYDTYDRPDKFTVYEDGSPLISSGWKGYAPYPGPWGSSLSTASSGTFSFNPIPGRVYQLRIEVAAAGPAPYDISDNFYVGIICL